MTDLSCAALDAALTDLLKLSVPAIGISFLAEPPAEPPRPGGTMPAPRPDGRTGAVPAGCVFWTMAPVRSFTTLAADHANCSVGSVTHGFKTLAEVAGNEDVAALIGAHWVTEADAAAFPAVARKPGAVLYQPLAVATALPDVVFLRLNGKQLMLMHDAWPELRFEGKPQCHIIPIAKAQDSLAVTTGCIRSRVRTAMSNNDVTCAIPGARLAEVVARLREAQAADLAVAAYAAADAKRFDTAS